MAPTVTPNLFQLSGSHIHITYTTTGIDGKPTLTYQDPHQGKSFRGDEIRTVECDLGSLVSVTLRTTIDSGTTSLSVFIPRMRINQGEHAAVRTECVITVHRFTLLPPQLMHGQLDTYGVVALQGTAQAVVF
jgi:hypothetical protein